MFIEILKSIVLGIVQGITEWLPISSTGHMILFDQFLQLGGGVDFVELFLVVIQFGSILAVITLFFNKLNPFSPKKTKIEKNDTWSMWFKVLVGVIPASIIGLKFDDTITAYFYNATTVATTLIIYGVLFIILESTYKKPTITTLSNLTYKTAFLIGMFQVLALIPGTSRSGATILGAVFLGASRFVAAEFSFFLAVPIMLGASGLKILKFLVATGGVMSGQLMIILLVGMVVAYVVSVFVIKFFMEYIKKHDFKAFGYYRIILGIVVIVYFALSGASVIK